MEHLVESHLGGYYITNMDPDIIESYCEECGDHDRILISWEEDMSENALKDYFSELKMSAESIKEQYRFGSIEKEIIERITYLYNADRELIQALFKDEYISEEEEISLLKCVTISEKKQLEVFKTVKKEGNVLALIVAKSINNVIGKDGKIPWNIKGEQRQFKELTTGNTVIMGRKTYEDIGHPLPNRLNIVVSKTKKYEGENLITVDSLHKAIEKSNGNIFIAGGYRLFKEAINLVDTMYITEINLTIPEGDVFFPKFDNKDFSKTLTEETDEYKRYTYKKKLNW